MGAIGGTVNENMPIVSLYFLLHILPCTLYSFISLILITTQKDEDKSSNEQLLSMYLTLGVYLLYNIAESTLLASYWFDLRKLWLEVEWQNHINSFKR